ncbi:MAG: TonB-dependent receptor, partial [Acidobacteriota bacterium]|nr:TonB-dependent receptor [Acidobacteriota bacterium]
SWGWIAEGWDCFLDVGFRGETRTRPGDGPVPEDEGIAAYTVVDFATHIDLIRGQRVSLQVRNVLDETYLAARRPAGLRPGLPRTIMVGFEWAL